MIVFKTLLNNRHKEAYILMLSVKNSFRKGNLFMFQVCLQNVEFCERNPIKRVQLPNLKFNRGCCLDLDTTSQHIHLKIRKEVCFVGNKKLAKLQ